MRFASIVQWGLTLVVLALPHAATGQVQHPREHLGYEVGADRKLADWSQITGYFAKLAAASRTVHVDTLGRSTDGKPFILATISSPENIARLDAIRAGQALLADPRRLTRDDERRLFSQQPAVILINCNIHATEIAASQMAMELAWRLATNDTLQRHLRDVVVLLIPSANPDGQQMVTEWYRRTLGTPFEGGPLPWLYHPYVGHDNNRDWYMVTQKETRLVTDLLYRKWWPEIVYDVHQMGSEGMRIFVPPMVDPINPNLDPVIVRGISLIGAHMAFALEQAGKSGVGDGISYDLWWHGGMRGTPTRHNMIGLLTEAASVRVATPLKQEASALRGHSRGLPKYEQRVNFPNPWPGGWWRLRDIVEYELIAAEALVQLAASKRGDFVRGFVDLARRQIALGKEGQPVGYEIPKQQHDPGATLALIDVLRTGGIEVHQTARSFIVRLDQPYRAHAKDLLEVQRFPRLERTPGGPVERPYDVAGWTLPLQMGVEVRALDALPAGLTPVQDSPPARCTVPNGVVALSSGNTESYRAVFRAMAAGSSVDVAADTLFVFRGDAASRAQFMSRACPTRSSIPTTDGRRVLAPNTRRIGLYRSWTSSMDEGWTRWLFEQFAVPFKTVRDSAIKAGNLRAAFDVLVIPDMSRQSIVRGMTPQQVPAEYAGGLGEKGLAELKAFVAAGGRVILLDGASEIAADLGVTGVELIAAGGRDGPYAPGSILRVQVDPTNPIALGMQDTAAIYFTNSVTFKLRPDAQAVSVLWYPSAQEILLSGYLSGAEALSRNTALVDAHVGTRGGRVVMFGFRPQHRGQPWGTFKLLFNALLL
ncbi:MAG TPA: M14 metallopeptidase family protein [Gemmatimonadaceae bacterium]|nr:M14 metallopeptidase family protein [Gemmatimonadaceae bacterium]